MFDLDTLAIERVRRWLFAVGERHFVLDFINFNV